MKRTGMKREEVTGKAGVILMFREKRAYVKKKSTELFENKIVTSTRIFLILRNGSHSALL